MPSSRRATVRSSPHVAHRAVLCTHTHAHIPTYRANTQSKHTHTEQTHNHNGACGVSGEVCHLPCPFHTRANTPHSHIRSHSHSLTHSHAQIPQPIPPPPPPRSSRYCDAIVRWHRIYERRTAASANVCRTSALRRKRERSRESRLRNPRVE